MSQLSLTTMAQSVSVRLGSVQFRLALVPTLATVILFPLLVSLGVWQLHRAAYKHALQEAYSARAHGPALRVDQPVADLSALTFHRVEVTGHYDGERVLLLDNEIHDGRVGFDVITPLRIASSGVRVLVNRGWVPMGRERSELPRIETPSEALTLTGIIVPPPERIVLGPGEPFSGKGPRVVEAIDIPALASQWGVALQPFLVQLDPQAPGGFARAWTMPGFGEEKSQAYAVQWFALAAVLLVIYVLANTRRVRPD